MFIRSRVWQFVPALLAVGTWTFASTQATNARTVAEALEGCKATIALTNGEVMSPIEAIGANYCAGLADGAGTLLVYGCDSITLGYSPMYAAGFPPSKLAAIEAFIDYAEANPELMDEQAADVFLLAFMTEFPCE